MKTIYIYKSDICFCADFQAEKVHELNEEIGKLLAKAEQLGAEGNVDEAQKVLQEVEKVRTKKKDAEVRGVFYGSSFYISSMNKCKLTRIAEPA